MLENFPGKRSMTSSGPTLCDCCEDVAIYKGAGMKDNFRKFFFLCIYHGPKSLRDHTVTHIEELKEFKEWKRKEITEAQLRHPSMQAPQLKLVNDDE